MDNRKAILNIIERTDADTKYVLDDSTPSKGIYRVLLIWLLLYTFSNILIYIADAIFMGANNMEVVHTFTSITNLFFFSMMIIVYYWMTCRNDMSLKERDFLKMFSIFIILFSFSKMLLPISSYLNMDFLIQLYSSIPVDLIINVNVLLMLFQYFKNKYFLVIIGCNIPFIIVGIVLMSNALDSEWLIRLSQIFSIIRNESFIIIISYLFTILLIHKKREY